MSQFRPRPSRPAKKCANPIFEQWIIEWKEDAETKNSKMKYVYAKALQSLRKYPLPLPTGKDCSILEGFGAHMCKMIENRMVQEDMFPLTQPNQGSSSVLSLLEQDDGPQPGTSKGKTKSNPKVTQSKKTKASGSSSNSKKKTNSVDVDLTEEEEEDLESSSQTVKSKQQRQPKQYVPAFRSGGYAILRALHRKENDPDYRGYMTKSELQREAQCFCDSSFDRPEQSKNTHYTAWSSMAGLLSRDLVVKLSNPPQYSLTPSGRTLAEKLASAENQAQSFPKESQVTNNVVVPNSSGQDNVSDDENENAFISGDVTLEPGNFEVVLYVDTCETTGRSKSQEVVNELQKNGVTLLVQRLSVGDFVWVARQIDKSSNRNRLTMSASKELILPYVVERKRADDLAHSIRDGRYHEQKHRLTQTKLNVIYLIESYGKGDWGLREGALNQAICNTQIVNDFLIEETVSIKETCAYLTLMTRHLKTLYEKKVLIGVHKDTYDKDFAPSTKEKRLMFFSDFNDSAVKKTHWNTKEMFARHLLKMKGISPDKAFAIVTKYPTLHHLMQAYSECATDTKKELMLSTMFFGASNKRIGPKISRKVYRFYDSYDLL